MSVCVLKAAEKVEPRIQVKSGGADLARVVLFILNGLCHCHTTTHGLVWDDYSKGQAAHAHTCTHKHRKRYVRL